MKFVALKEFNCCFDGSGIVAEAVKVGDVREFPESDALLAEGYIAAADMQADAPVEFAVETVAETKPVVRRGRK